LNPRPTGFFISSELLRLVGLKASAAIKATAALPG